jgi:YajG family uncharacterized lipoprotein
MTARVAALVLAALLAPLLGACASGLDVGYPEAIAHRALLASVAPRSVGVGPITDRRMDQSRIGAKPTNGDEITTSRPVADIVREALVVELTKNGLAVVPGESDIRIAAEVEDFWLDTAGHDAMTQYVGRVALAVAVMDGRSGAKLLLRHYTGLKRSRGEADSKDTWREVMNAALARTMRDIATDPDLVAAVTRVPASSGRSAAAVRYLAPTHSAGARAG